MHFSEKSNNLSRDSLKRGQTEVCAPKHSRFTTI